MTGFLVRSTYIEDHWRTCSNLLKWIIMDLHVISLVHNSIHQGNIGCTCHWQVETSKGVYMVYVVRNNKHIKHYNFQVIDVETSWDPPASSTAQCSNLRRAARHSSKRLHVQFATFQICTIHSRRYLHEFSRNRVGWSFEWTKGHFHTLSILVSWCMMYLPLSAHVLLKLLWLMDVNSHCSIMQNIFCQIFFSHPILYGIITMDNHGSLPGTVNQQI